MAGRTLTTASRLQCPHGGTVNIISGHHKVSAGGSPVATTADTFIITGCPFLLPPFIPSPCVTLRWIVSDAAVSISGSPTLSETSAGLCLSAAALPQGPVVILQAEPALGTR